MNRSDFLGLFAYDAWANRETLASIGPAAAAAPRTVALLAHVAAAEQLWIARIAAEPAPMPVWPELTLDQCGPALARGAARWQAYLETLTDAELIREVAYTNSKGQAFRSRVDDIATHVVFHSHYHRGQIASLVRAAGHTPAYTDFIHAIRTRATGTQEVRQ
jgi:uncharacterized damage-inducible protein DinB